MEAVQVAIASLVTALLLLLTFVVRRRAARAGGHEEATGPKTPPLSPACEPDSTPSVSPAGLRVLATSPSDKPSPTSNRILAQRPNRHAVSRSVAAVSEWLAGGDKTPSPLAAYEQMDGQAKRVPSPLAPQSASPPDSEGRLRLSLSSSSPSDSPATARRRARFSHGPSPP
jgi:hypothetical protein